MYLLNVPACASTLACNAIFCYAHITIKVGVVETEATVCRVCVCLSATIPSIMPFGMAYILNGENVQQQHRRPSDVRWDARKREQTNERVKGKTK